MYRKDIHPFLIKIVLSCLLCLYIYAFNWKYTITKIMMIYLRIYVFL